MLTIYGIASCDTCRKARRFLEEKSIEHRFHDVRENGLDIQHLESWAERVGWEKLLNKRSLTWRKVSDADRSNLTRNGVLALILEQPTLLKRPIIEADDYLAVGFSEERFGEFLSKRS